MFEIVKAGGIVMVPLILCSILAAAITLERLWTLRSQRVVPEELVDKVWRWVENRTLSDKQILALQQHSPLGRVLAAGLANRHRDRSLMIEAIEDAGRHVAHELERYLNALGTIAAISPLLGLLGTVTGMIHSFGLLGASGATANGPISSGAIVALKLVDAAGALSLTPGWASHDLASPATPLIVNGVVFTLATGASASGRGGPAVLHAYDGATTDPTTFGRFLRVQQHP